MKHIKAILVFFLLATLAAGAFAVDRVYRLTVNGQTTTIRGDILIEDITDAEPTPPPPPPPPDVPPVGADLTIAAGESRIVNTDWDISHLELAGSLTLNPAVSLTVRCKSIHTSPGSHFETAAKPGVVHTIILANAPDNKGIVCEGKVIWHGQPKDSYQRLAREPVAGGTTLEFAEARAGWQVGDRLVIPDSKQWARAGGPYATALEEATISAISADGKTITLAAPLRFAHPGARNGDDVLEFLPHVVNRTRSLVIKSESAAGTRGYVTFTGRADVDVRYVAFAGLGRTKRGAINAANPNDRFPVGFINHYGPIGGQANGYAFTFIGNSVFCPMAAHEFKGPALRNSHFGLIQENVLYNWACWSLATLAGNETGNMIEGNFAVGGRGFGDREGSGFPGDESAGFWFRGPNNRVCNNVATTCHNPSGFAAYGFKYYQSNLGAISVPTALGAETFVQKNGQAMPILEFAGNELYGLEDGLTIWEVNAGNTTPNNGGESVIRDTLVWHVSHFGYFGYPTADVTFDGWVQRGYKPYLQYEHEGSCGLWCGDYMTKHFKVRRADIQCLRVGIGDPTFGGSEHVYEDCFLRNVQNITVSTLRAPGSGGGGANRPPRKITIRNVTYGSIDGWRIGHFPSAPPCNIFMQTLTTPDENPNLIVSDIVNVENHNGTGIDFRVYYTEQAADWILPQTVGNLVGSPVAGLTNAEAWAKHGVARAGAVAPEDAKVIKGIVGLCVQK